MVELELELIIPPNRRALAQDLSALGFSFECCVFALRNCDDDSTRAVEFILNNVDSIEAMVSDIQFLIYVVLYVNNYFI